MIELADRVRGLLGPRAVAELEWRGKREPYALALPASVDELQELVRWARAERVPVAPVGLGSKLGWSRPPKDGTLALSTRRLQHLVEYEPAEGVITALAGTRMATLRDTAREHGHWLTPDVPAAENATLGGVIAAGQSGLDRLRHGPARHHVLGVRAVMADGSIAKSGGRLVKNVTGFDLPRLFAGSHGTLCVIVEATLRLQVAPRCEAVVSTFARDGVELAARTRALLASQPGVGALRASRRPRRGRRDELDALRDAWEAVRDVRGRRGRRARAPPAGARLHDRSASVAARDVEPDDAPGRAREGRAGRRDDGRADAHARAARARVRRRAGARPRWAKARRRALDRARPRPAHGARGPRRVARAAQPDAPARRVRSTVAAARAGRRAHADDPRSARSRRHLRPRAIRGGPVSGHDPAARPAGERAQLRRTRRRRNALHGRR
ncbi:MAG: FAD-binding oxidoreductase [Planctomycetes bacterium]|nr:FAD-binding oxidoreductase [Planctomycetota bacterium]